VRNKRVSKKQPSQRTKRKRSADPNLTAKSIVDRVTDSGKNPAAVVLGRLGGLRGGPARARRLSSERRKQIARKAAEVRWHGEQQ